MANMQIYPLVPSVIHQGVEVNDPAVLNLLLPEWRGLERILIQDDGTIYLGLNPATKHDGPGAGLIDEITRLPSFAVALKARDEALLKSMEASHDAAIKAAKAETHVMSIIAKKATMTYWSPTMPGYEDQFLDPLAGDRMYSRGRDAERDGYKPGVLYPKFEDAHPQAKRSRRRRG